jgi:curved DNA-binding protein CbpA
MDSFDRQEPPISDYYADLGLQQYQQASHQDVKYAYFKLARNHHPDKMAPGKIFDAHEFRKVSLSVLLFDGGKEGGRIRELIYHIEQMRAPINPCQVQAAYDCLRDKTKRVPYDASYVDLQNQWTCYRELQETQRKKEKREQAEEEEQRAVKEKSERERLREEKVRQAEERSREAGQRARDQQE